MELILGVRLDLTSQIWGFFPKTPKVFPKIPEVFFPKILNLSPKIPKAFPKIMIFSPKFQRFFFLKFWFFFPKIPKGFFSQHSDFSPPAFQRFFPPKFQRLFFPMMKFHINFKILVAFVLEKKNVGKILFIGRTPGVSQLGFFEEFWSLLSWQKCGEKKPPNPWFSQKN